MLRRLSLAAGLAGGAAAILLSGAAAGGAVALPAAPVEPTPAPTGPVAPDAHLDNPFVGAKMYVDPDWSAKAAAEPGGERVANQPTAVWLDSIAAITAPPGSGYSRGLRAHLDGAMSQGANLVTFVLHDLPGRNCWALAPNNEFGPTDVDRYKAEFIDPIAAIQADPKYRSLRIVNIIEPNSLSNLVTSAGPPAVSELCRQIQANGSYVTGISYALSKLHAAGPNNYEYLDAADRGVLGWDSNLIPSATLLADTARKATGGVATVDGVITDVANYSALKEPFFQASTTVGGRSVRQSQWVDWNTFVDELGYAQAYRQALVSRGFSSTIGMLIDTGRNGWGGPGRPAAASPSTDLETFVDESRVDRRIHASNWCNQVGAGLGERPRAAPAAGIDAYLWVKPPGESDGSSTFGGDGSDKGYEPMCDPTYGGNSRNGNHPSGAKAGAPPAGEWFSEQFRELMANAYPPLPDAPVVTPTEPQETTVAPTREPTGEPTREPGASCSAVASVRSAWGGGFVVTVRVTAGDTAVDGWTVRLNVPAGASITNVWNGNPSGNSVSNMSWNGHLPAGGTTEFGLQGDGSPTGLAPGGCVSN